MGFQDPVAVFYNVNCRASLVTTHLPFLLWKKSFSHIAEFHGDSGLPALCHD